MVWYEEMMIKMEVKPHIYDNVARASEYDKREMKRHAGLFNWIWDVFMENGRIERDCVWRQQVEMRHNLFGELRKEDNPVY